MSSSSIELGVVLFQSVHHALHAEKILLESGIQNKLIPVPRHLSSNCGFCLRFKWQDREAVTEALANRVAFEAIQPL